MTKEDSENLMFLLAIVQTNHKGFLHPPDQRPLIELKVLAVGDDKLTMIILYKIPKISGIQCYIAHDRADALTLVRAMDY